MPKKKILIAEDDQSILEVMTIILSDAGYEVLAEKEGSEVEKKIVSELPDLVLLDIWIGGRDGGVIAHTVKHQERTKHIPIVMISANNDTQKIALKAGADGFLQKPFDVDDLITLVKKYTTDH